MPDNVKQLSHNDFKKHVTQQLSVPKPPIYYLHGRKTQNILHTRLRTDMSHLNAHLFKIQKVETPACSCGHPVENTSHFVLACPKYNSQRHTLLNFLSNTLNCNFTSKPKPIQLQILLHGTNLSSGDGRVVARHFQNYLQHSLRFSK